MIELVSVGFVEGAGVDGSESFGSAVLRAQHFIVLRGHVYTSVGIAWPIETRVCEV